MATKKITDQSFATDVINAGGPVLVDFWAEWCGPCKMIGPSLEEISDELGDRVTIAKINIDDNPDAPYQIWRARHPDDDPVQGRPARPPPKWARPPRGSSRAGWKASSRAFALQDSKRKRPVSRGIPAFLV
jgi:thiol-disulfide isomerase/thioredoxin